MLQDTQAPPTALAKTVEKNPGIVPELPGKATKAEITLRVEAIKSLLLSGADRCHILQYSAENYGLKTRQVDTLIKRARELLSFEAAEMQPGAYTEALRKRKYLYMRALDVNDLKTAHGIEMDLSKLLGLYPQDGKRPGDAPTFPDFMKGAIPVDATVSLEGGPNVGGISPAAQDKGIASTASSPEATPDVGRPSKGTESLEGGSKAAGLSDSGFTSAELPSKDSEKEARIMSPPTEGDHRAGSRTGESGPYQGTPESLTIASLGGDPSDTTTPRRDDVGATGRGLPPNDSDKQSDSPRGPDPAPATAGNNTYDGKEEGEGSLGESDSSEKQTDLTDTSAKTGKKDSEQPPASPSSPTQGTPTPPEEDLSRSMTNEEIAAVTVPPRTPTTPPQSGTIAGLGGSGAGVPTPEGESPEGYSPESDLETSPLDGASITRDGSPGGPPNGHALRETAPGVYGIAPE